MLNFHIIRYHSSFPTKYLVVVYPQKMPVCIKPVLVPVTYISVRLNVLSSERFLFLVGGLLVGVCENL